MDIYVSELYFVRSEAAGIPARKPRTKEPPQVGKLHANGFQAAAKAGATIAYGNRMGVYPHRL